MSLWVFLVAASLLGVGCASQRPFEASQGGVARSDTALQASAVRAAQPGDGAAAMEHELAAHPAWAAGAAHHPAEFSVPREMEKVPHPTYIIEPPDVLLVDAARLIPLPPYKVEPLDALA